MGLDQYAYAVMPHPDNTDLSYVWTHEQSEGKVFLNSFGFFHKLIDQEKNNLLSASDRQNHFQAKSLLFLKRSTSQIS